MWYGDGENEPYTTDFALTALGRLYVLSMQYLMETYNDSTVAAVCLAASYVLPGGMAVPVLGR